MSFFITLTNNSMFAANTRSNFITLLPRAINLDWQYEVALVEFTYPISIQHEFGTIDIIYNNNDIVRNRSVNIFDKTTIYEFITVCTGWPAKGLTMTYDKVYKTMELSLAPDVVSIVLPPKLLNFFRRKDNFKNLPATVYYINPKIDITQNMFIHCDIIEDQYINDRLEKLLKIVKIQGENQDAVSLTIDTPHYHKVDKTFFNSITINITDKHGHFLNFTTGDIILKLHFRKKNKNELLCNSTKRRLNEYIRK